MPHDYTPATAAAIADLPGIPKASWIVRVAILVLVTVLSALGYTIIAPAPDEPAAAADTDAPEPVLPPASYIEAPATADTDPAPAAS